MLLVKVTAVSPSNRTGRPSRKAAGCSPRAVTTPAATATSLCRNAPRLHASPSVTPGRLRTLDKPAVLDAFRRDATVVGPDRDDYCPCGSYRRARSCHAAANGEWLAVEPSPLLNGPPTGKAVKDC